MSGITAIVCDLLFVSHLIMAVDLGQPRHTGPCRDGCVGSSPVNDGCLRRKGGAWSYDAHVAFEDVQGLGDFVNICSSQQPSYAGGSELTGLSRFNVWCSNGHRAKLVDGEDLAVLAGAVLHEQYGATVIKFDGNGDKGPKGEAQNECGCGYNEIQQSLSASLVQPTHMGLTPHYLKAFFQFGRFRSRRAI